MTTTFGDPETDDTPAAGLFARLPDPVRASLTDEQSQAIADAARDWRRHAVDLRLTLPWPGRPVFLTLVAGRDRRAPARRAVERRRHPLLTLGNVAFGLATAVGVYAVLIVALVASSTILDF